MAVGAGVLLVLGSACGSSQGTNAQPAPQAPATTQAPAGTPDRQPARTPPDGAKQLPAKQVDYSKLPKGFPHMVWLDGDGKTIGAVAQEGGCGRASAEVSDEGADKVILTLVETQPAKPRPCTMDLRYPKVTTQLELPLGNRTVVVQHTERKA
ncbi:hypothetical protein [Labedaea rhizosphaerae]|uniref:hypothetical protein n=1 Tax=Labedaea rhizosphaerae TaxID=598644 RepID=UPI001AAE02AB|nr:hypothetical protein [Labedaea rhizosphaerae]